MLAMEHAEQNKRDYEELARAAKTAKIVAA
jgi:hypothetical protein